MTNKAEPDIEGVACPLCGYFPPEITVTDRAIFSCMSCEHVWTQDVNMDVFKDPPPDEPDKPS